jgi:hypothetical protein
VPVDIDVAPDRPGPQPALLQHQVVESQRSLVALTFPDRLLVQLLAIFCRSPF